MGINMDDQNCEAEERRKRSEILLKLIEKRFPSEGVKVKHDKCIEKLCSLDKMGLTMPQIVGKFVEAVMESPLLYLDIDAETIEKLSVCKGSLGSDYFNIQPRGKKISAELIAV